MLGQFPGAGSGEIIGTGGDGNVQGFTGGQLEAAPLPHPKQSPETEVIPFQILDKPSI